MTYPISSKTRLQIRQAIGYNLDKIVVGTATSTGTTTSLIDTRGMAKGGDNEYDGRQVQINTATEDIVGEKSFVSRYESDTNNAILNPAFTATTTSADTYEMWSDYTIEQVNSEINNAIVSATDDMPRDKEDHTIVKETGIYEYSVPSGFVAVHTVEYESKTRIDHQIHACDVVWDEVDDADVTESADTTEYMEGSASLKLVVALGCAAGDILASDAITSLDISDCDEVIAWVHSTTALDAGDLQILLDNDASCASPTESLNIPAITANKWTAIKITMANPASDTAIISVGVKMVTDKDAFTFRIDDIRAQHTNSRIYKTLPYGFWSIVQASTNRIQLTEEGYSAIGKSKRLRLKGYQIPAELSDDTTACTIDPDYIIAKATASLLMGGATKGDIDDRYRRADWFMGLAERRLGQGKTNFMPNTRWVS